MNRLRVGYWLFFGLVFVGLPTWSIAADGDSPPPQPVTIDDPDIPTEELALLLKPLTKDQLLIEADAWQGLVQAKAEEIAEAEIAVKRQNREIAKADEIIKQAETVKKQLEEVELQAEQARDTGATAAALTAEEAAVEARTEMADIKAEIDAAADDAETSAQTQAGMSADVKAGLGATADAAKRAGAAVDEIVRTIDDAQGRSSDEMQAAAAEAREVTGEAARATDEVQRKASDAASAASGETTAEVSALEGRAEAMADEKEAQEEEKLSLLEVVSQLREERTVLLDQLKAVIAALETKTDQNDAETLAKIQDYRLYATAVSGIELDVKDTTSAWLAIKGWVTSEEGGIRWGLNLLKFFGILLAAWVISGIFSGLIHRGMKRVPGTSRLLEDFLVKAARWIVLAVGLIMALAALEISIGPLLALVGAAGFVIAFALQDSLSNFASGMMILFFKPFDVGDVVDAGGVSGSVDSMNLVSTTIKTFDNKRMVVPNNKIWGDVITNASGVTERRVDMEFGIGYDDDIDKALGILEEIVAAHPNVLPEPAPTIRMNALADSSVNFIVRPWAKTGDYWGVYWDITREVKKRFDAEGIGIPFPQRDVHLYIADGGEKLARLAGGVTAPSTLPPADQKREDGGLDN